MHSLKYIYHISAKTIEPQHTSYDSFYKWTKISSHEIDIFGLKVVVKSGLGKIILNFTEPLQSCCCPVQKILPRNLAWQVSRYLWRGSVNFKIKKKSRPLFTIILSKNVNFKTRDFSPTIKWDLAGVHLHPLGMNHYVNFLGCLGSNDFQL